MTGLRGFGLNIDLNTGAQVRWYAGKDGIRRNAETDMPLDLPRDIPRPDLLDVTYHNNEAIEPVRDSALAAEDCGTLPRMEYTK